MQFSFFPVISTALDIDILPTGLLLLYLINNKTHFTKVRNKVPQTKLSTIVQFKAMKVIWWLNYLPSAIINSVVSIKSL